jgi:hypothetical protein
MQKKAYDQLTVLFENFVYPQSSDIIGSVGDGLPLDDWSAVMLAAPGHNQIGTAGSDGEVAWIFHIGNSKMEFARRVHPQRP